MKSRVRKAGAVVVLVALVLVVLTGCYGTSTPKGWAGVNSIDDTLVFVSMTGKIYSVDSETGAVVGSPITLTKESSGGSFLSCGSSSVSIPVYPSPVIYESGDDQLAIIGGTDGRVYAFPFINGSLNANTKWEYPAKTMNTNIGSSIVGGLVLDNGVVYFSSALGQVYAIDAEYGDMNWSYDTDSQIWGSPVVADGVLYIGSYDNYLYAIDTETGELIWKYDAGGAIIAQPVVEDGIVYIGGYNREMHAVNTVSGQMVWKYPSGDKGDGDPENWFWTAAIVNDGILIAPNMDGNIYCLNATNGNLVSKVELDNPIMSTPVVVDGELLVATTNIAKSTSKLYAIDLDNYGKREVTSMNEAIKAQIYTDGGMVYIHTGSDNFYGINPANGSTQQFSLTGTDE